MHTSIHVYIWNIRYAEKQSSRGTNMHASSNTQRQIHTRSVWGYLGQVSMDREKGRGGKKREGDTCGREIKVKQTAAQIERKWATKEKG